MRLRSCLTLIAFLFLYTIASGQQIDRVVFDAKDSTNGYYLAVKPQSNQVKGVLVLLSSFLPPEDIFPETKLHNVASVNDLLTVAVSMKLRLYADESAVERINAILKDIVTRFGADTGTFVLAGYDESGNIAIRYTEMSQQFPAKFLVHPKAVIGIDSHVDLFGLWRWSERQVRKNYYQGQVGDAKYYLETMTKENGTIYGQPETYQQLTPFNSADSMVGNEQYLKNIAVRLYYDNDVEFQLASRGNSLYDTKLPDGSELISRLMIAGNKHAELITAKQPGRRSNGERSTNSFSIVDEVECIHWIKKTLHIFDQHTWKPPYQLVIPAGWSTELFPLPADFAPSMTLKGVEDIRFTGGWGDSASTAYWSYAYLWWLDGSPDIDAAALQHNLSAYYAGLVARNIISRNIPVNKQVPVAVSIKKIKAMTGDSETYNGTIKMLDYMLQRPMLLNVLAHVKNCTPGQSKPVLITVSPQDDKHAVWKDFETINAEFKCN